MIYDNNIDLCIFRLVLGFYVSYFTMPNVGGDLSRQAMILYDSTVHSSDSLKQKVLLDVTTISILCEITNFIVGF
jgi:hypothetical protein